MSSLDVEALLESTAKSPPIKTENGHHRDDDRHRASRHERRDRESHRHGSRDRERDRKRRDRSSDRSRAHGVDEDLKSEKGSQGGRSSKKRSQSPGSDKHKSHRHYHSRYEAEDRDKDRTRDRDRQGDRDRERDRNRERDGERYHDRDRDRDRQRGSGRYSREDEEGRFPRHSGPDRRDRERDERYRDDRRRDDRRGDRRSDGDRRGSQQDNGRHGSKEPEKHNDPQPTEDERDRRTVFVQQLAQRLRTKELIAFFEKVGPVKEAQIVKDRVSGRSKGVGYVEFLKEESVQAAIDLTGQQLLRIPIIVQLTEAEKNRQAKTVHDTSNPNQIPFHRLYVGNIHFSITESDLQNVFEPFGELEFVQLQKEEMGRSRGYGFVQFRDPNQAREALEKMNGFDLAGRPIRVGLGNDKFTPETTANLLSRFQGGQDPNAHGFQGSAFSGSGGQGRLAGGSNANFDRAGRNDNEKGASGASALDDTDVAGVNFSNYSRDALMRKLARTDEPEAAATNGEENKKGAVKVKVEPSKQAPIPQVPQASRCVLLKDMFDPAKEEGESWPKDLEDDVRAEADEKYGKVVHIHLDPSSQGDIYLKFEKVTGGENAIKGLNGRFFGGRQITATPVVDAVYSSLFARTKAL